MKPRSYLLLAGVAALVVVGVTLYLRSRPSSNLASQPVAPAATGQVRPVSPEPPATNSAAAMVDTNKVYRVTPDQVLASVNGVHIRLGDLIPLATTNAEAVQMIDEMSYEYFMKRAINRELMMQAAKKQGISLTDSQMHQLGKMRALREQSEPGLVAKLNVDQAQIEMEMRDAEAFMLQNQLMEQLGSSPNVTPEQVESYYRAHAAEFGEPPTDPQARAEWWQKVDPAIRNKLAAETRQAFDQNLERYREKQKSEADIKMTPQTPQAPPPPQ